jgi:3-oxoacyl-[acyl-carrier-protein] synthase-3
MGVRIVGTGGYLPTRVLTNDAIERETAFDRVERGGRSLDEWARFHHGGITRHVVEPGQPTSELATEAAKRALCNADVSIETIDIILLATFTGDYRLPQAAACLQANLGSRARFIQIDAACSGFIDGLQVAHALMKTEGYRRALVVSADVTSMLNRPGEFLPRTVFGDGAGAVVLELSADNEYGIRSFSCGSDGELGKYVYAPGGGSRFPTSHETVEQGLQYWQFDFSAIAKWGVDRMVLATRQVLERVGISLDEVDLIIPHQASRKILERFAATVDYPMERIVMTYPSLGNISGASIPVALDLANRERRLKNGDWLLMPAVGAGMAWGAVAYRWADPNN